MKKYLLVGDVHATVNELDDCQNLIDFVIEVALTEEVQQIIFMGDQFHTMSLINLEVLEFWKRAIFNIKKQCKDVRLTLLTGNHDLSSNQKSKDTILDVFYNDHYDVSIVSSPGGDEIDIVKMPYYRDPKEFVDVCNKYKEVSKTVICHQTFNGAQYENGFYAPDGVNPDDIPQKHVISGHIHLDQRFSKVHYVGSPRWRTAAEANLDKAIYIYEFNEEGEVLNSKPYYTDNVCKKIWALADSEESPLEPSRIEEIPNKDEIRIDIKGSESYINKRKQLYQSSNKNIKLRIFKTINRDLKIKESEGVKESYFKYLESAKPKFGTNIDTLKEMSLKLF